MKINDLKIDFVNDRLNYRKTSHKGKSELIAKALGWSKGVRHVLDLTCGLAQDTFFIAQLGFKVEAFERSKPLYEILSASMQKAREDAPGDEILGRVQIYHQDSISYLASEDFKARKQKSLALYIDPMFPEKTKSALPRKEMVLFRELVGPDQDSELLLKTALASGCSRVIVKRPLKGEPLLPGFTHQFKGSTIRYDLYVP